MGELLSLGVMGIRGSFSEEAALEYARDNNLGEVEIVELLTTEKVLRAVEAGEIDIGIFALENSNGGVVYESVYAMAAHRFKVVDLFEIDVNHTLLVHPSLPGRESIERIASHQQAIRQCRMWLRHHFPTTLVTEEPDTAEAARMLATGELPASTAVIAAERCAELFGLRVLERRIQDLKFNFTTFVATRRGSGWTRRGGGGCRWRCARAWRCATLPTPRPRSSWPGWPSAAWRPAPCPAPCASAPGSCWSGWSWSPSR